ncbi:hypothetical protein ANN_23967 [Periplaneta americana]|uniref:Uncharacterized protein n=1 Tax=Periplaneta americana TaxID=6978 RepID=A0ABQ8S227_PERAM|nr:hypothetical protein ANN_23967 [Periplaneta americana]
MAGLCEGGNEPSGSLKAICKRSAAICAVAFLVCDVTSLYSRTNRNQSVTSTSRVRLFMYITIFIKGNRDSHRYDNEITTEPVELRCERNFSNIKAETHFKSLTHTSDVMTHFEMNTQYIVYRYSASSYDERVMERRKILSPAPGFEPGFSALRADALSTKPRRSITLSSYDDAEYLHGNIICTSVHQKNMYDMRNKSHCALRRRLYRRIPANQSLIRVHLNTCMDFGPAFIDIYDVVQRAATRGNPRDGA